MFSLLLADDNALECQITSDHLRGAGYRVTSVADGLSALDQLRQQPFDLLIADVLMPRLDGFELCRRCREEATLRGLPIILCSGSYTEVNERQLGLGFGANRYLLKPVDPDLLLREVASLLQQKRQPPQPGSETSDDTEEQMQLLRTYNEVLFRKLDRKMHELTQQLEISQKTRNQLLHNEKLAAIGQMAAGVVHEINNPLSYLRSNLGSLQTCSRRVRQYLEALEAFVTAGPTSPQREALRQLRQQLDLDYLLAESEQMLHDCQDGSDRILAIVKDMRSFSRKDEEHPGLADLNALIRSSLNICHNQLKYHVELDCQLAELPLVPCYPQQISQVLVNLLVNAAQAIEQQGHIRIRSFSADGQACVEISDSGCGMNAEVLDKIFDPFFTTKPAGIGTGLGLPISADIVRRHGGSLRADSQPGQGSRFCLCLPLAAQPTTAEI